MARRTHTHSAATLHATATLGNLIATARRERRVSVAELCERAGISAGTLRAVERGAPTVAIGVVFEVATILAIPLFDATSSDELAAARARSADRLSLLPKRVGSPRSVDDDF
jgi:transcriptional regulator with XRE-family HTH domain